MKVLFVDDEVDIVDVASRLFEKHQIKVVKAISAKEAIQYLEDDPLIGVIITDINMPGIKGLDMLELIAQKRKLPPSIVITGYPSEDFQIRAEKIGAIAWITKPFSMQKLYDLTVKALESYQPNKK